MEEVEDEPLFAERVAGIDIGKKEVMVTIRVPSDTRRGRRQQETRSFRAVRKDLLALADWLRAWGVTKIGMEATGDYWKPVYFLLEREGFDCVLYHAAQVKALPGRPKTDKLDSVWLAKITERGSLPGSFVPPEEIRRLRTHTRYRRHLVQARTAEKARCEKLLEDAHLKLSSVITDIHGVSGREMLAAIIAGQRNPKVLAQMARTRMRGKITQLEEALDCSFFTEEHAFVLAMMLANIDHLTAQIKELTGRIEALCQPYLHQIGQLDAIPGFGVITAQDIIAEIGVNMAVFPTAGHLCSWARQAPGGPPLPWTVTTLGSLGTGGTPMVTKYQKFGDAYKAEAVKLYRESNQTIAETARNLGLKESTLANWVKKDKDNEAVAAGEAPLTPAERTRIRELEADVRRLNMENAFLKKASAYFASQNL